MDQKLSPFIILITISQISPFYSSWTRSWYRVWGRERVGFWWRWGFLMHVAWTQMRRWRSQTGIFWKKVVYSFLLRIKIQNENVYSKKEVFFNFEAVFWLSVHLWIGGEKSHPPKRRQERPAGISKLSRHAQLMTLCNMSEIPDGDEPRVNPVLVIMHVTNAVRIFLSIIFGSPNLAGHLDTQI